MEIKKDKRYTTVRFGRLELSRLLGMLDHVNFDTAANRYQHPYTRLECKKKDRALIRKFNQLANRADQTQGEWHVRR